MNGLKTKMNAVRVFNWKTLRYLSFLALAAIFVYLVGNLSGLFQDRKVANIASSSKSDTSLTQQKQAWKPTLESHKDISDREKTTDSQELTQKIENLPRTSLDLVLLGIMKGDNGYWEAVIEDKQSKTQGIYAVGSTIRGARVMMISETKVVLRVDGKDQVLDMNTHRTENVQQNLPQQQGSALPTDEPSWDDRSSLGYSQVSLKVRLKPYIKGGNQEGFEVKSVLDDSPLKAIGLEDGDIIKSINGEPIDSDLDILQIHDAIKNGDSYTVSVVRDGKPLTLSSTIK